MEALILRFCFLTYNGSYLRSIGLLISFFLRFSLSNRINQLHKKIVAQAVKDWRAEYPDDWVGDTILDKQFVILQKLEKVLKYPNTHIFFSISFFFIFIYLFIFLFIYLFICLFIIFIHLFFQILCTKLLFTPDRSLGKNEEGVVGEKLFKINISLPKKSVSVIVSEKTTAEYAFLSFNINFL